MKKAMNKYCLVFLISVCAISPMIYRLVPLKHLLNYFGIKQSQTSTSELIESEFDENISVLPIMLGNSTMKPAVIEKSYDNFVELAADLRTYASTGDDILKQKLFPWLFNVRKANNSNLYTGESKSKGIVICTGSKHFSLALVALKALQLIENELPIEVVYSTPNDLSLDKQNSLKNLFPEVRLVDLSSTAFNDSYLELRGWEIKPFAVLASRFEQVLLMDADVLFLEKPLTLFENKYYTQTGSLFFYDRPGLPSNTVGWIQKLLSKNRQNLPRRTQESGVVLIDKSRVYLGLLSTCKLNDHLERERVTYKYLYGDKDTWWLGFHIINLPYSFIPTLTASIGQIMNKVATNEVCGHILHLDEDYRPVWWNGGTFRNRYVSKTDLLKIEGWLEEGQWHLQTYSCLTNNINKAKKFNTHQQQLIASYIQITKELVN